MVLNKQNWTEDGSFEKDFYLFIIAQFVMVGVGKFWGFAIAPTEGANIK